MNDIIDEIDKVILDKLSANMKAYGLCIPILKGTQTHPVTWEKNEQVAINDRWDVNFYHHLLNDNITEDMDDFTFGRKMARKHTHLVRTVVAVKKKLGHEWIDCFIQAFPEKLDTVTITSLTDYKFINISFSGIGVKNTDQEAVYKAEFGPDGEQYEKHRIPYLIYAVDYSIDFIKCCLIDA